MICKDYVIPSSIEEALATLASLRGEGRVIAGGTDLVIQLRRGRGSFECLVDITRIPGLDEIRMEDSHVLLGAAVTFSQIEGSALVREKACVLAEAASQVGSPQIRNVGTLAGNIVNAQPAADGSIALLALDAKVEIANLTGRQWVPVTTLHLARGRDLRDDHGLPISRRRSQGGLCLRTLGPSTCTCAAPDKRGRERALER